MQKLIFLFGIMGMLSFPSFSQNTFTLSSESIGGQGTLVQEFNSFGCAGENRSPQLTWSNAPKGTQSYAITMYDPDAPTGSGWWLWLVFDIPTDVNELLENAGDPDENLMAEGVIQSLTDYGFAGFGGPCPPKGDGAHQYIITIHALKVKSLGLKAESNAAVVGYYLSLNTIEKASIVMYYGRD